MQVQQAVQEAQSFLRNGQDIAQRSPVNPDTLYMWDNQVQAIETFLANTEELAVDDDKLAELRKELRTVKKQIETKVLEFELKQDGQELPPEPTEQETLDELTMYGKELQPMLDELVAMKFSTMEELRGLDEARAQVDNFVVETESFRGKDADLDGYRKKARETKALVDEKVREFLKSWQANQDEDE
jgi:hypothetical protein